MKRKTAGILIIVLSMGALGFWELWGRENISYHTIAVLKENTAPYTEITEDMISFRKADYAAKGAVGKKDCMKLVGLETSQYVAGGTELHMEYFREPEFRTGTAYDRYVLMIPETWLMSMPESIMRGDTASFYLGEKLLCRTKVIHVKDSYGQEITAGDRERLYPTGTVNTLEVILTSEQMKVLDRLAQKGNRFTLVYSQNDEEQKNKRKD